MTELSLQRHNKDDYLQTRIETDLKYAWKVFCKKNNLISSQLIRKWILEYMKKYGAIRVIEETIYDKSLIKTAEDLPGTEVETRKLIEINL